jgi:glutaredoxin
MMGSKDRNFLAGLAGGLQAGEDVKKSMGAENRAMQQASLQAQLAHAKYQDAIRRGDYDAADRAAREERTYRLQTQKLMQEQAMMPLEVGLGLARAMQPKGGGEAALKPKDAAEIQMKVMAVAKPELDALETEYKKRAKNWFFDRGPQDYQNDPEYQNRRQAIIQRVMSEQAPQLMGVAQVTPAGMRQLVGR